MRILFNQKLKITAFITTLLVVGFMNKQPIKKQQTTENLSLSPILDSPIARLSNNLLTQKPSNKSILYSVINEWQKYQYSINSNQVLTT